MAQIIEMLGAALATHRARSKTDRVVTVFSEVRVRRSADFQSAVSPISNRLGMRRSARVSTGQTSAGWKPCDTAGWKPALLALNAPKAAPSPRQLWNAPRKPLSRLPHSTHLTHLTHLTYSTLLPLLFLFVAATGCSPKKVETPEQRSEAAKALFEHTTKTFHIPSAEAKANEKEKLQNQAAEGYEQLLKKYPEQDYWAAQALRSLGNIRSAQGKLDAAVKSYAAVEKKYPQQRWEVLMSWKSAADLLWEAGRREEAKAFYRKIVTQYDIPEASQLEKTIVRGSKTRLAGGDLPPEK